MVKVNAPALSLDASGKLGGAIVFSKWKGRNYVRQLVVPANPKSAMQVSMRAMLKFLAQNWTNTTSGQKATWEDYAAQLIASEFNAFVSRNQQRWRNFLMPSCMDPATEAGSDATIGSWAATGGVRQITLSWAVTTASDGWGIAIFRSTSGTFTESLSNAIAVVYCETGGTYQYVDTPLDAGTYYYSYIPFTIYGKKGSASSEVNATCT